MDKNKLDALRLQITAAKNNLQNKRRKFLLGIWLGYSVAAFAIMYFVNPNDSLIGMLVASAALGALLYVINAAVWSACCRSIFETDEHIKKMEKEYADLLDKKYTNN